MTMLKGLASLRDSVLRFVGSQRRALPVGGGRAAAAHPGWALACRTWRTKRFASRFAVRQASSPWRSNS